MKLLFTLAFGLTLAAQTPQAPKKFPKWGEKVTRPSEINGYGGSGLIGGWIDWYLIVDHKLAASIRKESWSEFYILYRGNNTEDSRWDDLDAAKAAGEKMAEPKASYPCWGGIGGMVNTPAEVAH